MTGLIVVDHGSKLAAANEMLEKVVALMAATAGYNFEPIVAAHMELAEPSIAQALTDLYMMGVREAIVFPYFLSPGRHTQEDIPRLAREAAAGLAGMQVKVAEPFGLSPKLVDAALQRIRACRDSKGGGEEAKIETTRLTARGNRTTRRMRPQL
ncbi:MAG: CbiX/SirB N-terminal domain-containing protein [Planctomycetota bacterium]